MQLGWDSSAQCSPPASAPPPSSPPRPPRRQPGWGGDTQFLDADTGTGLFVSPRPCRAVLFDQDLLHRVTPPSPAAGAWGLAPRGRTWGRAWRRGRRAPGLGSARWLGGAQLMLSSFMLAAAAVVFALTSDLTTPSCRRAAPLLSCLEAGAAAACARPGAVPGAARVGPAVGLWLGRPRGCSTAADCG